ncbi:MAG: type II secretion system protein [Bacilli bacterium]|nr:type II secretion system protein [Bacilli bacterium]
MKNKKGFTLIELLAVIVILAVVMLIAATAVLPMMTKSRKNALLDEGVALEKAAKLAYQDPYSGDVGNAVCYPLSYLYTNGFFEKGAPDDNYYGSVLIYPSTPGATSFKSRVWISNGTYAYVGKQDGSNGYYGIINSTSSVGTASSVSDDNEKKVATYARAVDHTSGLVNSLNNCGYATEAQRLMSKFETVGAAGSGKYLNDSKFTVKS